MTPSIFGCTLASKPARRIIILFAVFVLSVSGLSAQLLEVSYSLSENWEGIDGKGKVVISGEVKTRVDILSIHTNYIRFRIHREMTPYPEAVDFETTAYLVSGKYEFKSLDNWDNAAFGYIQEIEGVLDLMLDCEDFSDIGQNLGRLYGDIHRLQGSKPR